MLAAATIMLLDLFWDSPDPELNVRFLSRGLALYLSKLDDCWILSHAELQNIVIGILSTQAAIVDIEATEFAIEIMTASKAEFAANTHSANILNRWK